MLVYSALIAFVAAALIIMFSYIQRRVMGTYQQAGDAIGEGEQRN
jgi:Flp pilus assembly pilin Flp